MSALVDLEQSLAALDPRIEGTYVYHCVETVPSDITMFAQVHEAEGTTLILTQEAAREANLPAAQPFVLISLGAYTSLSAVGITATIAQTLASRDIPCNVVAGFHHDHLFVPSSKAAEAMRLLSDLSAQAAGWLAGHGGAI